VLFPAALDLSEHAGWPAPSTRAADTCECPLAVSMVLRPVALVEARPRPREAQAPVAEPRLAVAEALLAAV
jgi:hypothetical protein